MFVRDKLEFVGENIMKKVLVIGCPGSGKILQ